MSPRTNQRKCKLCAESMPANAIKCPSCSGFQNWRSHLDFGNTFLSLIVAFLSVLTVTIPIIIKACTANNSDVAVYYIDRSDVSVPVIVANDGPRPAIMQPLAGLRLEFEDKKGNKYLNDLILNAQVNREALLIPKETTKQYFFFVEEPQPLDVTIKLAKNLENGGIANLK
jgi:hypothetical protein